MSDPATAVPVVPPPPASNSDGGRGLSTTPSPPSDHAGSCSAMASVGSSSSPPPRSPPSLPSSTSKAPPSVSGSRFTATSPPTTVSRGPGPPASTHGAGPRPSGTSTATMSLNPNLPSRDSQLHVAEARAALVASMSNMLDSELQSRASLLHANATVLSRQEQDVARATEALRKENDKLAKVAKDAGRKIKELGNVQNWAEVLERDFLVLEETMRLVRDGGANSDEDDSCSECSGSYWSGSESERDGEGERSGSRKGSVGDLRELKGGNREEKDAPPGKEEKAKGQGGSVVGSGSSTIWGESNSSNTSLPTISASNLPGPTNGTVSLDQAVLDSLAEALATDMRIGLTSAGHNGA